MVRISSSTMVRMLSRLRRPKFDLSTQFSVPPKLWQRIQDYSEAASNVPAASSSIRAADLLHDLFKLSQGAQQKALVGSILLEHKKELPIDLDCEYLRSLVTVGQAPEAIRLWKLRRPKSPVERKIWQYFGIEIHCMCHRPQIAEKIVNNTEVTLEACLQFIAAYGTSQNHELTQRWCDNLINLKPSCHQTNAMLRILISAGMWPIVQQVLPIMNELNHSVDPALSVACFRAAATFPLSYSALSSLAALLESDGSLVNVSQFRKAIAPSAESQKISQYIAAGEIKRAVHCLRGYSQPDVIAIAYKILKHMTSSAQLYQGPQSQVATELFSLVNNQSQLHKSSIYIQFMLTYFEFTGQYQSIWSLMRPINDLYPYTSYANHTKFWQILHRYLLKQGDQPPVNLREVILQTTSKVALQPILLRRMVLCLSLVSDLPALVTLLQFAYESSNVQVDASSLFCDVKTECWEDVAQAFADQHHADLPSVLEAGREFRYALQL